MAFLPLQLKVRAHVHALVAGGVRHTRMHTQDLAQRVAPHRRLMFRRAPGQVGGCITLLVIEGFLAYYKRSRCCALANAIATQVLSRIATKVSPPVR